MTEMVSLPKEREDKKNLSGVGMFYFFGHFLEELSMGFFENSWYVQSLRRVKIPWKYFFYHMYRDVLGVKKPERHFRMRSRLFCSLTDGVFESQPVDFSKYLI